MSSMRQSEGFIGDGLSILENVSNESRAPGSSSDHRIISMDTGSNVSSHKMEKKAFYSRIPPYGRTGSADKKTAVVSNTSIKLLTL